MLHLPQQSGKERIEQVLDGIPGTKCILDDMVITGKTDEEHLQNLQMVLKRLQEYGLRAHTKKCAFFQDKIKFCGHEIDTNDLHKTQEKIHAVIQAPRRQNVTHVNFLPNFSTVVQPLNNLLQGDHKSVWTPAHVKSHSRVSRIGSSPRPLQSRFANQNSQLCIPIWYWNSAITCIEEWN